MQPFEGVTDWKVAMVVMEKGFDAATDKLPEDTNVTYESFSFQAKLCYL